MSKTSICDIKSTKKEILKFVLELDSKDSNGKLWKNSDEKLEDAVYLGFWQKGSEGRPISGMLLCTQKRHCSWIRVWSPNLI